MGLVPRPPWWRDAKLCERAATIAGAGGCGYFVGLRDWAIVFGWALAWVACSVLFGALDWTRAAKRERTRLGNAKGKADAGGGGAPPR